MEYGFIESPYRKVRIRGFWTMWRLSTRARAACAWANHIEKEEAGRLNAGLKKAGKRAIDNIPFSFYLSAWEEDKHTIAQANIEFNEQGRSPRIW